MKDSADIQSVSRAFALLELLAENPNGMRLAQICEQSGLAKTSAFRMLSCLAGLGYVYHSEESGRYRLSFRIAEVSRMASRGLDIVTFASSHLQGLADECLETVHLVVRDGADAVYLSKMNSREGGAQMASRVGMRVPLYCTAVGKAILSTLPYDEVGRVWSASSIEQLTPRTVTDRAQLERELEHIRATGFAIDDEENELGIRCVALPLKGMDGTASAAFSISGLAPRMSDARLKELAAQAAAARDAIERDMGII